MSSTHKRSPARLVLRQDKRLLLWNMPFSFPALVIDTPHCKRGTSRYPRLRETRAGTVARGLAGNFRAWRVPTSDIWRIRLVCWLAGDDGQKRQTERHLVNGNLYRVFRRKPAIISKAVIVGRNSGRNSVFAVLILVSAVKVATDLAAAAKSGSSSSQMR